MKAHGKKHRLLIVDDATYLLFSFKRLQSLFILKYF